MIQRIELVNFMSHQRTVIEPAAGLTVLIGQNNVGKSALVAALQILAANDPSTFVMRHGQRECSITIQTTDEQGQEHTVVWGRKTSPSYTIDGQRFDRLKNELPEELHPILRLPRIKVGGNTELDVHIASQKNPIFLLDSQANAARLFASSSDTSKMLEIQKRHKEKHAAANQEKKRLDAEAIELALNLAKLEPLSGIDAQLHTAEALYQEWLDIAQQIAAGEQLQRQWQAADLAQQHCGAVAAALEPLTLPPVLDPTEPCAKLIAELLKISFLREQAHAECAATAALAEPPCLPAVEPLAELAGAIARFEHEVEIGRGEELALCGLIAPPTLDNEQVLRRLLDELDATLVQCQAVGAEHESLERLRPLPAAEAVAPLQALCGELQHWQQELNARERTSNVLARLSPLPEADDPQPLARALEQLQLATKQFAVQEIAWQALSAEYSAAGEDLAAAASESTCPTCGQAFDPQLLLDVTAGASGGHAHG